MDPATIMALIGAAASMMEAMKGEGGPEGGGLPAAGGENPFGENIHAKMMGGLSGTDVPQYNAEFVQPDQSPLSGLANIAPEQELINPFSAAQASTFSQGVDAPNIAPEVGGSTGGEISIAQTGPMAMPQDPSPLMAGESGSYEAIDAPEWQGPMPQEAAGGDPRLQQYMQMLGPLAGMIGASAGAGGGRAPGSGGFPARPFNIPPSMNSIPRRRRY